MYKLFSNKKTDPAPCKTELKLLLLYLSTLRKYVKSIYNSLLYERSNLSMILASNMKISDSMIIDLEGQYQWRLWCACRKKLPLVTDSDAIEEVQMDVPIDPSPSKELEVPSDSDKARASNSSVNSNISSASGKIKLKPLRGIKKLKAVVKSDAFKCVKRFETLNRKKTCMQILES